MNRAFSLIELLLVIAIVAVIAVLVIPMTSSMGNATSLAGAAQVASGSLELARQTAVSQNRTVEVRFYKLPPDGQSAGTPSDYRALQLFLVDFDVIQPQGKVLTFPAQVIISPSLLASGSSGWLMDNTQFEEKTPGANQNLPPYGTNYRFRSFRFKPDGGTDLPLSKDTWCFTLLNKNDPIASSNLPANYATIHIEPLTGKVSIVRP